MDPGNLPTPQQLQRPGLRGALGRLFSGIPVPAAVACCVSSALLIVSHHQGDTDFFRTHFNEGRSALTADLYPYLYWQLASFVLFLPLPVLAAALTPGVRVRETGIGPGDWRFGLVASGVLLAAFLPIVFLASRVPQFAERYPMCGATRSSLGALVAYELCFALYFIAWEYLFRGYLLFSLEKVMGKLAAFATMMPFAIVHYGKPQLEVFGAIVAGVALGLLALRTRSFWYGALLHLGSALAMDVFAIWGHR